MSMVISGSDGVTFPDSTNQYSGGAFSFKNRLINGAMMIDQRNAGASVTPANGAYGVDRWQFNASAASKFTAQQVTDAPTGFGYSLKLTSSSAYTAGASELFATMQPIEGFNFYDLSFGSASAKSVTVSFWVKSSLTGTFGGSLTNYAQNRFYPFSYTISSANTWEQKSVTISGDTSGTWVGASNAGAAYLFFSIGCGATISQTAGAWTASSGYSATGAVSVVGTNGATFYITGVQLEVGSVATPFERRPYGTELALCQRYYIMDTYTVSGGSQRRFVGGGMYGTTQWEGVYSFPVEMRAAPTLTTSAVGTFGFSFSAATVSVVAAFAANTRSSLVYTSNSATGAAGYAGSLSSVATNGVVTFISWSAEL